MSAFGCCSKLHHMQVSYKNRALFYEPTLHEAVLSSSLPEQLKYLGSTRFRSRVTLPEDFPSDLLLFGHMFIISEMIPQYSFSSKLSSYGSQKQADRWEWDADNMQKSWTWRRFRLLTWFVSSDTIKKKSVSESRVAVCVSRNVHRSASKRRNASSEHLSLNSPPRQSVWQTWQSCQAHQINTRVREWEHLGGGKRDGSQSQLVSAYATLNNAPFQMVNLLNLRLPLAPHSQRARRAPGREHKDSSRAAMTEEQPQQSLLLSVRSADALNMSLLQCERWTFKSTCGSHYSSHLRNTQIR